MIEVSAGQTYVDASSALHARLCTVGWRWYSCALGSVELKHEPW